MSTHTNKRIQLAEIKMLKATEIIFDLIFIPFSRFEESARFINRLFGIAFS